MHGHSKSEWQVDVEYFETYRIGVEKHRNLGECGHECLSTNPEL